MPGWIDNLNGMTGKWTKKKKNASRLDWILFLFWLSILCIGVMAGLGKGFLRVLKVKQELVCDIIPVDYPINMMIAVARYTALYK
jgi:hypothetical protein